MGLKMREKSCIMFLMIIGPGPFAGSLSQNLTPGDAFFQLDTSLC